MSLGRALASLGAVGAGWVKGDQMVAEQAAAAAKDQRAQEEHDARMADVQRQQQLQASLSAAAAPAQVDIGAGGMTKPASADNSDVGQPGEPGVENGGLVPGALVNGQAVGNAGDAAAAAAKYNDPNAVTLRQVSALQAGGKPMDAMALQKGAFTLNKEQSEYARTLQDEGAFDATKALRSGDGAAMKDAFNRNGKYKVVGEPEVTPEKRTIPGIGPVTTYNAKLTIQNPDGTTSEKTYNSHDLSMQLLPFDKGLELQRKAQQSDELGTYREGLLDVKGKLADATAMAAQARAEATAAKNAQGPGREERLRWTSLFQDAGRQMIETQKTINQLQRDPVFMSRVRKDPNSTEAQQLTQMQAAYADHKQSRDTFRGLLAGAAGGPSLTAVPGAADPGGGGAPTAGPKRITSQADRDALPKGTPYIAPDGQTYIKQ